MFIIIIKYNHQFVKTKRLIICKITIFMLNGKTKTAKGLTLLMQVKPFADSSIVSLCHSFPGVEHVRAEGVECAVDYAFLDAEGLAVNAVGVFSVGQSGWQ